MTREAHGCDNPFFLQLIAFERSEHATHTWMPGTGITLVCGRDSYNPFDTSDFFQGQPSFMKAPASACVLQPSCPVLVIPVSANVRLATLPSFTEPLNVG